jgi:undecaprenyl-diphosphatase
MAFGVAWITLLGTAYHYHKPERVLPRGLLLVVGLTLVLAGGFNIYRKHETDLGRYAIKAQTISISVSDWLGGAWQRLATQRTDLVGEDEGPLTVQWAGKLETLDRLLRADGWQAAQPLTMNSALAWISPAADPRQIPALPLLQEGLAPSLTLILPRSGNSRLVLRVWPTSTVVGTDPAKGVPLWLGAVIEERLERPVWPFTLSLAQRDLNGPRDQISGSIGGGRLEARPGVTASPSWDGRVLLIQEPDL